MTTGLTETVRFNSKIITDGYNHRIIDAWGKDVIKFIEDFTQTPIGTDTIQGWTTTLVEGGSGETTVTLGDASGGTLIITTDDAENDGANMQKLGESFRVDNNSFYFGARFKASEATQSDFFVGLSVTDTAILTNLGKRIGFRKVDGATGVAFEMEKTATTSVSEVHTMEDDEYVELEILYDMTAAKLYYYVNGEPYLVSEANLPDTELRISLQFLTGAAAIETLTVDWIRVFQFGRA